MNELDDLILLGKVVATQGIRGELRVICFSGEYDTLMGLRTFFLRGGKGDMMEVVLSGVRRHAGKAVVTLKGYDGINKASDLVGREILIPRAQLPKLEEGEYYWHDLLGLRVISLEGEELGILKEIIETGSNDVYVVVNDTREYLIPAMEEVVREIDLTGRKMTVSPMEGLFDL